jgi:nitrogenase molybdenum-iron protein NifN
VIVESKIKGQTFSAARNGCKVCAPLGASVVFRGIENGMALLHGSQGCSTYIRRYMISHFKEPVDIASSNFAEATTIFGGKSNLFTALDNLIEQYHPALIGVASTCLSETIGENVPALLQEYRAQRELRVLPVIIPVSTPSYSGTHMDGFHDSVRAIVESLALQSVDNPAGVSLLPGFVSPADLRYVKEILRDFELPFTLLPDYSDSLDAPAWDHYRLISPGGTPIKDIQSMGGSIAAIEFGRTLSGTDTAAQLLVERFGVKRHTLGLPIGITETDRFFALLSSLSGKPVPVKHTGERLRLVDSYFDAHKAVFGARAVVYGEEDLAIGLCALLSETGIQPVLCASGGESGHLEEALLQAAPACAGKTRVMEGVDFAEISEEAEGLSVDLFVGNSKGYTIARKLKAPLVRVGFPIHDRYGAQRQLHLGYRGAQGLFDQITNALIQSRQDASDIGYLYM